MNNPPEYNRQTSPSVVYLLAECSAIFFVVPLLFYFEWVHVPKVPALLAAVLCIVLLLWFDDSYDLKWLMRKPGPKANGRRMGIRILLVAVVVLVIVLTINPDFLFAFPRQNPGTWIIVMLLYPLLSALPQELMYREFFFHRYKSLFGNKLVRIAASAVAFSFLHIIYDNYWAPALSLVGGILFAWNYHKNRSLYWVSLEHALYGCIVFTVGLGRYFYEAF